MSQNHEQQQERSRLKNQTKALYQATRRANPVVRSLEQSSDTGRKRIAREEPGVREQRQEQEQPANTRQRAVAREEPGTDPIIIVYNMKRFKVCRRRPSSSSSSSSVPIEFPRKCISVNPRNCTYAFPRMCISTYLLHLHSIAD